MSRYNKDNYRYTKCKTDNCNRLVGQASKSGYCFPCKRRLNFIAGKILTYNNNGKEYCTNWKNGEYVFQ